MVLWSGQVVSTIGTRVTGVAFPLLVLAETHSPAKAGIVGFAQTLPYMLFYLPAGALVDRWDRKRTMIVADAGRTLALGSLAVALALDDFTFAQVVVVAFVEGTLFVFFSLSESAALPQVVPKEQLPTAVAQNQARIQGADLVGQPLGGALFGISKQLPFAADAISYAVSLVSLLFIRTEFQEERPRSVTKLREEMLEGVRWLWGQPFLRAGVLLVAGSNFAFSAMILALIVRAKSLGASSATVGVMLAFLGGGAIVGSLVAPAVQRRVHAKVVMIGSFWVWALGAFLSAFVESPYALGAIWAVGGIFGPIFNVAFSTYRYALVPDRLLARVGSAALVVAWGAIPLGQLTAGFLLERIGSVDTILVVAAASATVGLAASLSRTIRTAPRAEELLSSA
ncbi:MAG: MFS transporter [Actinobacteria bacterium]|nr:MAG: MFS transporter [Actinomycetota bacterium]